LTGGFAAATSEMSFTISLASLILLSLSIAGAYCRSISTTSIPARLRRSSFSPSSIAAATLFRSLAFQTAFVPTCQNSPRRVFVYYISLKTIAFIWCLLASHPPVDHADHPFLEFVGSPVEAACRCLAKA
jgi:hypothetical protein